MIAETSQMPAGFVPRRTLFVTGGIETAELVETIQGDRRVVRKTFKDAHAALSWCEANSANMIYTTPAPNN